MQGAATGVGMCRHEALTSSRLCGIMREMCGMCIKLQDEVATRDEGLLGYSRRAVHARRKDGDRRAATNSNDRTLQKG